MEPGRWQSKTQRKDTGTHFFMKSLNKGIMEAPEGISSEFIKRIGKISHHSAVFVAGNLFTVVAGWFYKVYVARSVGATGLGIFGLGMTVVGFFSVFASFGLPTT